MYHEFARMPGESYRRRLRSLLFDCVTSFRALIISLVCRLSLFVVDWFSLGCVVWNGGPAFQLYNTLQLHCLVSIHWSFIANCQYNILQFYCQLSIQYIGASLLSVNTIHCSFIARGQYNCAKNVLWCQIHSLHIHANHKT